MFDVWFDAARDFSEKIQIPYEMMEHSHAIVCGALRTSWIEDQALRTGLPGRGYHDVHPIYRLLSGATEESVLEVCDLAALLLEFRDDPCLLSALESLRDHAKCESALMELRIALALKSAGFAVQLYPATPKGIADIAYMTDEVRVIVEVSAITSDVFSRPAMIALHVASAAVDRVRKRLNLAYYVAVEVSIDEETSGNFQQDLDKAIVQSVKDFSSDSDVPELSVKTKFGSVKVRLVRQDERPYMSGGGLSSCMMHVERPSIGSLHNSYIKQKSRETDWVHILYDDSIAGKSSKIIRKLKTESRQLSGVAEPQIIALDISGLGIGVVTEDNPEIMEIIEEFERNHSSVAQVWLLTRVWSQNPSRWVYRGLMRKNPHARRYLSMKVPVHIITTTNESAVDMLRKACL